MFSSVHTYCSPLSPVAPFQMRACSVWLRLCLLLCSLCLWLGGSSPIYAQQGCPPGSEGYVPDAVEFAALKELYLANNGANWANTLNSNGKWDINGQAKSSNFKKWYGVTVDACGDVVKLELYRNNLLGIISNELANLTQLTILDLSSNSLSGSIPTSLGNLTRLTHLKLSANQLTGNIPESLGNLTQLQELWLYINKLTGTIPVSLGNMTQLNTLLLYQNELTGSIPVSLGNLPNLVRFDVIINNIDDFPKWNYPIGGRISVSVTSNSLDFGDLEPHFRASGQAYFSHFEYFVQNVTLGEERTLTFTTGQSLSIPLVTGGEHNLYQWQKKDAGGNWVNIAGVTNATFTKTAATQDAGVYRCVVTNSWVTGLTLFSKPITVSITSSPSCGVVDDEVEFQALKALYESTNGANWTNKTSWETGLAGPHNSENFKNWVGVTVDQCGDIMQLNLEGRGLIGVIPSKIGTLSKLQVLWLANNRFTNSIPPELGNLSNLQVLKLGYCHLIGSIPATLGNLTKLQELDLSNNELIGNIPEEFGQMQELVGMFLPNNHLSGSIPLQIGALSKLRFLYIYNNKLTGSIPNELGVLTNLQRIRLFQNQLSGSIPVELGNLVKLEDLTLSENKLVGSIPRQLGNLTNLVFLSLSNNQLTGTVPIELSNLSQLNSLELDKNQLTGSIPPELGDLKKLVYLNVSDNKLVGTIPSELGNLSNISLLYLSSNQLSGSVPATFSNLTKLEELVIHTNQLSGSLPASLANSIQSMFVHTNKFHFGDLEPFFTGAGQHSVPTIEYSPQAEIGEERSLNFTVGQSLSIPLVTGGSHNLYQWQKKDASGNWVNIAGATSATLTKTAELSDAGVYRCVVTNSWVTNPNQENQNLILFSKPITVTITLDCGTGTEGLVADEVEFQALRQLYIRTNGSSWTRKTGWEAGVNGPHTSANFKTWQGVTVNACGDVVSIRLVSNNLTGNVPVEVGNLAQLKTLTLTANSIAAFSAGNYENLEVLTLTNNKITGFSFQNPGMPKLKELYAGSNLIVNLPILIGSLSNLEVLDLSTNRILSIPNEVGALNKLKKLLLAGNGLQTFPATFQNLTSLEILDAKSNVINNIPVGLGSLQNLQQLFLENNKLGTIPAELGQLQNLKYLGLSYNLLITVPDALRNLSNLQYLYLDNNKLTDFPAILQGLTSLKELKLERNQLQNFPKGDFSSAPGLLVSIGENKLDFGDIDPYFTGINQSVIGSFSYSPQAEIGEERSLNFVAGQPMSIPLVTGGEHNLYQWQKKDASGQWLNAGQATSNSDFSKTATIEDAGIYRCIVTNRWATQLTLYSKPITVTITPDSPCGTEGLVADETEFQALRALFESTVGEHWYYTTGWLESWNGGIYSTDHSHTNFKNWYGVKVDECGDVIGIDLSFNGLTGELPKELGNLSQLQTLDLGYNTITGNLPVELGKLTELKDLNLWLNKITGTIPVELGKLTKLEYLDLSDNQLTGQIPVEITQLKQLTYWNIYKNKLTGTIPTGIGNLSQLQAFIVADNQLTGSLPAELGMCKELVVIEVGKNQLTGQIPAALGSLPKLVNLFVYENRLDDFPKWLTPTLSGGANVANNRLDFGDMENFFTGKYQSTINFYAYAPQAEIGKTRTLTVIEDLPLDIPLVTPGVNNKYQWQKATSAGIWVNISNSAANANTATSPTLRIVKALPTDAGIYRCVVTNTWVTNPATTGQNLILSSKPILVKVVPPTPICETTQPEGGFFGVNTSSGMIEFSVGTNSNASCATGAAFTCLSSGVAAQSRVVATSATTFSHDWTTTDAQSGNPYENGTAGKWRPLSTYAYNTTLADDPENYRAGTFTATPFNWGSGNAQNWIPATTVTRYSDNGEASEEQDVLGNYSSAKFGYGGSVPYLVAQNAQYAETLFEGFENAYVGSSSTGTFEDQIVVQGSRTVNTPDRTAHSGKYCLRITNGTFVTRPFTISETLQERGLWCKVWIRVGDGLQKDRKEMEAVAGQLQLQIGTFAVNGFRLVAQVGEWSLCEALITKDNDQLPINQSVTPTLRYTGMEELYIDDFRMQPADAQVMCYVYDESLRPVATFDDQHFALLYQYNTEGKLVRKLIETERGVKTVQETQYNMPKVSK